MKQISLLILFITFSFAGFFNETAASDKAEYLENERLCKLFTQKMIDYKKTMREDFLAATTLASYEHRAELFCKKADIAKQELPEDLLSEINSTK
jgi:hypothetical protein